MQSDIERRLHRLERRNKALGGLLFSLLVLVLTGFLIAARAPSTIPDEIVAHSVRVVGAKGKNSALLTATPDGFVGLFFNDLQENQHFTILMTPSGKPTLTVLGPPHTPRLELGAIDTPTGEEFSVRLLADDHSTVWQPEVKNRLAGATPAERSK